VQRVAGRHAQRGHRHTARSQGSVRAPPAPHRAFSLAQVAGAGVPLVLVPLFARLDTLHERRYALGASTQLSNSHELSISPDGTPSSQLRDGARGREHPRYHSSHPNRTTGDTRSVAALPQHTQLGAPQTPPPAPGVAGHTRGAVYSTGGALAVFFQAIDASALLAVLLIATLLLLTPQVLPTRCARPRQLTERTDGCIGGYEGPWACQHTLLGMHNAAPLPLSQRRRLHITSTAGSSLARGSVRACPHAQPATSLATSCREAAPSSSCSTDALVDSAVLPAPTFTLVSGAAGRQCGPMLS
jgi:hypothetical protein